MEETTINDLDYSAVSAKLAQPNAKISQNVAQFLEQKLFSKLKAAGEYRFMIARYS